MNLKENQMGMCAKRKCGHEFGAFVQMDELQAFNPAALGMQLALEMGNLVDQPCVMCPEKKKKAKKK